MRYFIKVSIKYAQPIYNVNIINNHVYYDDYKGYRTVTDINNIVTEKDIDKQVMYNLFTLKKTWQTINSMI